MAEVDGAAAAPASGSWDGVPHAARSAAPAGVRQSAAQLTLLLGHEISNVRTAMRYNSRWAVVPSYYEEDRNEPSKYDDAFRVLRAQIYGQTDWSSVDPMSYLAPFLALLKASDVSGPITGAVAVALQRILASDLLTPDTAYAGPAINALVEDTTQGKFESTNNAQDEVVLLNIVQVLGAAVSECKAGVLLTDDTFSKAFQAAFMLGDPVTKPKEYGEIMGYYSRQVCGTMVRTLFTRLRLMAAAADGAAHDGGGQHLFHPLLPSASPLWAPQPGGPPNPALAHSHFTSRPSVGAAPLALPPGEDIGGSGGVPALPPLPMDGGSAAGLTPPSSHSPALGSPGAPAALPHPRVVLCMHGPKAAMDTLDFLIELMKKRDPGGGGGGGGGATGGGGAGSAAAVDGTGGLSSSAAAAGGGGAVDPAAVEESAVFALGMVQAALLAAGRALADYDVLVAQVHVELLAAVCDAVVALPSLAVISATTRILACLYTCLGDCSIGQLELVISRVALRLADGVGVPSLEHQEVALEGLVDLLRTPGFVHDVYVNCDCRLERSDLFVAIAGLMARTAHPAGAAGGAPGAASGKGHGGGGGGGGPGGALGPLHLAALEGLAAILAAISQEDDEEQQDGEQHHLDGPGSLAATAAAGLLLTPPQAADAHQPQQAQQHPVFVDIWTPMVLGQHPDLTPLMVGLGGGEGGSMAAAMAAGGGAHAASSSPLHLLHNAVAERALKLRVAHAVDTFNKDHKKGLAALQAARLIPLLDGSPAALAALAAAGAADGGSSGSGQALAAVHASIVSEDELAVVLGRFLHSCPGLNKQAIGELLGEPDAFYLKVLDAYTESFDFSDLKFDAAIRMFLESFRLPGEAQKIDRIINCFGKHFYSLNRGVFANADAAYVLAYSVIMLNTDRHNPQVKRKMDLDGFRRNLRGVNGGADFPVEFLNDIFNSIVRTELRMTEAGGLDVSEQRLVELHQLSRTPRGHLLPTPPGARALFNGAMFRATWGPMVAALSGVVDAARGPAPPMLAVATALEGLERAAAIAAAHGVADVADTIVGALARIPMQLTHITPAGAAAATAQATAAAAAAVGGAGMGSAAALQQLSVSQRPDVVFGRDARMCAVMRTIAIIANRHGDCLTTGWSQLLELVVVLYRQGVLPDAFTRALDGDGEGGLAVQEGEATSLLVRRITAAKAAAAAASTSIFRSFSAILGGGGGGAAVGDGDPYAGPTVPPLNEADKAAAAAGQELLAACALEDVFLDAKFLKQESLVHLVRAVIAASGPIPRPTTVGAAAGVAGSLAYTAGGMPISAGWDVSELALELLFGVLLRNRDRFAALWPAAYDHLQAVFRHSREVDQALVQKAVMAVMRLCLRLLPYKQHIAEPLVRGVQLVSLVDEQVASDMAPTIAAELLALLKGASPYLRSQQVWVALTGLLKIIQYDPPSFPACVEALSWVVAEGLSPTNFPLILPALVDLLERAAERRGAKEAAATAARTRQGSSYAAVVAAGSTSPARGADAGAAGAAAGGGGDGGRDGGGADRNSPPPAPPGDPLITHLLHLLRKSEEWLEVWWVSNAGPGSGAAANGGGASQWAGQAGVLSPRPAPTADPTPPSDPNLAVFQQEAWLHVMSSLCRAIKNPNLQVRLGALDCLQRAVVAAEKFAVPPPVVQRVLQQLLLPMTADMCRQVVTGGGGGGGGGSGGAHDFPLADVSVRELIRALAKVVLLYAPVMGNASASNPSPTPSPSNDHPAAAATAAPLVVGSTWGPAWRALLDVLVQGMAHAAPRSELLAEAIPEALKNMVLMLAAKGALVEGWRDASDGVDLHEATWRAARKVSANLTPAILQLPRLPSSAGAAQPVIE